MSGGKSAGAAKNFNQGMVTVKRPNGSRLSCGAGLEHSQGEFYHTARKTFSGSLGTGAASFKRWLGCAPQVIARVRPRQELRGALTVAYLPWNCDAEPDRCSGLATRAAPQAQRDLHLESALESNRTTP